jgi:hypothetical protein
VCLVAFSLLAGTQNPVSLSNSRKQEVESFRRHAVPQSTAEEGKKAMSKGPEPTTVISSEQSWGLIWLELKKVDIAPSCAGPFEGGILWGQNANQAIQALRDLRLPLLAVHQIGVLIQAAIRASEVRFRPTIDSETCSPIHFPHS